MKFSAANLPHSVILFFGKATTLVEALQSRLNVLEDEILRLTNLASQTSEKNQQENHWLMARDLQREARQLRAEITKITVDRRSSMSRK